MYFAHVVPLDVWRDYDVLTLLPIIAVLNYVRPLPPPPYGATPSNPALSQAMLITLHATGACHIRLRSQQDWWLILVSLAWMGSAYFFQLNDREEAWCNPDSPFQAHAYWHVGMAVACLFVSAAAKPPPPPRPRPPPPFFSNAWRATGNWFLVALSSALPALHCELRQLIPTTTLPNNEHVFIFPNCHEFAVALSQFESGCKAEAKHQS
jgi:hypothetical protein